MSRRQPDATPALRTIDRPVRAAAATRHIRHAANARLSAIAGRFQSPVLQARYLLGVTRPPEHLLWAFNMRKIVTHDMGSNAPSWREVCALWDASSTITAAITVNTPGTGSARATHAVA